MNRKTGDGKAMLSDEIRRQFGASGTTRFLRSLPAFQVDSDMPDRFHSLLAELDKAESEGGSGNFK